MNFYEIDTDRGTVHQLSRFACGSAPTGGEVVYASRSNEAQELWFRYRNGERNLKGTIMIKDQDYPYRNIICESKYHVCEEGEAPSVCKDAIRDHMIEILCNAHLDADPSDTIREHYTYAADLLIEAGATIQRWVPIEERVPTIHDANADNCVLAIHKACKKRYFHWRTVVDNPFDFTHWMPVPADPSN